MRSSRRATDSATPSQPERGGSDPARILRGALGLLLLATLILQVAARGPLRRTLWGFHQYAYLPAWVGIVAWVGLGGAALWVLLRQGSLLERLALRAGRAFAAHPHRVTLGLAVACGAAFWLARSHQTVLGDGWPLLLDLPKGQQFHPRQPLAAWLQQRVLRVALAVTGRSMPQADTDLAMLAVAAGSVACGVGFAWIAAGWGRLCARLAAASAPRDSVDARAATPDLQAGMIGLLVTLLLLTQGYSALFYGYIENYTFPAVTLGAFLLTGALYLGGRTRLVLPLTVYLVLLMLHLSMVALSPVLLVLLVVGWRRAPRATAIDLVIAAALGLALHTGIARLSPGYSLWAGLRDLRAQTQTLASGERPVAYLFTLRHVRDFLDCQHLIGPLGAGLLLPVSIVAVSRHRVPTALGLFVGGAAWLMLCACSITPDPTLGYGRDWDLFAPSGVAFASAALLGLTSSVPDRRALGQLLVAGLLLSCMHTLPWIAINHSEQRSVTRLADLPLGNGRAEVAVGFWYLRNGQSAQARPWFERAVALAPYNVNAHQMLGHMQMEAGHPDSAAASFAAALRVRPDKLDFHAYYAEALLRSGRFEEALQHLDLLCQRLPDRYFNWFQRGLALEALNRNAEALEDYQRALPGVLAEWGAGHRTVQLGLDRGVILMRVGRVDEGITALEEALALTPIAQEALGQVASLIISAGRPEVVRPHLEHLLELYPNHAQAPQIRAWLAQIPPAAP